MTWWRLEEGHGVLELDEPALELHCLRVGIFTIAWWADEHGRWLWTATVGEC
jgi:hypothetical protein